MSTSTLLYLECSACATQYAPERLHNVCPHCSKPLLCVYDLQRAAQTLSRQSLSTRPAGLGRYAEVLPLQEPGWLTVLSAGGTPLVHARRLARQIGCPNTFIKDESLNSTGSFKARGMAVAVGRAQELGAMAVAVPSAGNAAGAMAAYAAAAGLPAHVFMPNDVPRVFRAECTALGAHVTLVDGLINDCAVQVRAGVAAHGWFEMSTMREPYRVEGKKTMAYEVVEQLGWRMPDVIIYPTGGGTGLIGMWRAFDEMQAMQLIGSERPRMVCVQAEGCAPIVRAFTQGDEYASLFPNARTVADGLRVPIAIGDFLMLRAIRASNGIALCVSDADLLEYANLISETTGIFACPEGGACLAAQVRLLEQGWISPEETVVLFNTGTGLKYAHLWA